MEGGHFPRIALQWHICWVAFVFSLCMWKDNNAKHSGCALETKKGRRTFTCSCNELKSSASSLYRRIQSISHCRRWWWDYFFCWNLWIIIGNPSGFYRQRVICIQGGEWITQGPRRGRRLLIRHNWFPLVFCYNLISDAIYPNKVSSWFSSVVGSITWAGLTAMDCIIYKWLCSSSTS